MILNFQVWWSWARLCTSRKDGVWTAHCVCGDVQHSCWQTTRVRKRTKEHCRHVLWETIYQTLNRKFYHTCNSRKCMWVNRKALQRHAVFKKPYFLLQVMCKSVSGTASHKKIRIRYSKSCTLHLNVQWNWRFVWLNHYHHSTKIYWKKYHSFVAVGIVTCAVHS